MPDLKVTDDSPQRVGYFDELNSPNTSAYTLPRVAGTSGQVITIDANGDCNFQSVGAIGSLGSIEFRALPYFDNVNAAADDWDPSGKTITPELYFNLSQVSYSATKANNTWRYDESTGLTFSGGTEDTGVSRPALGFATHTDGNTNPNVTGNFIFTDAGGTDNTFSFRIDWILIQEGAAGSDGAVGTAARGVILTASDQSIEYNKDGTTPDPTSVTVFAEAVNASESSDVYFEFFIDDVSQGAPTAAGNDSPFAAQITITSPTTIGSPKKVECQIREGGASNPILARDQIVIFPLKQGSDAITIILSNEAHTLPTTNSGTVTYTDSGTDIEVYEGTNQLGYDGTSPYPNSTYRVSAVGTNVTVSTPTTVTDTSPLDLYSPQTGYVRRYGDHSNMTSDSASIEYTITVKNDEGKETVFTKKQSLAKSIQGGEGADGTDGRTVTLSAGDQLFDYDTNGANPTGKNSTNNTTVITAEARNTTGTLYYEFFVDDSSVQLGSSDTYTYTAQADIADMPDKIEVELREGNNSPQSVVARDQFTIFGLQPGSSAITIAMSNEAHSIRTGPLGDSPSASYPGSGTTFDVFEGNVQLDYDDSVPYDVGTYRISADTSPTSDITIGTASTAANGKTRIIGDHSNMVNGDDQIVYEVTVKRADGTETTFTRTQTLNKSEKGETGDDAKTVRLTAADYVIEYDQSGKNPTPASTITLTATAQNFVDPYFKFTGDGITDETVYTDGTGDSDTFSFSVPADYSSTPKTIRVGVAEASADTVEIAFDSTTIASVKEGSGNVMAFLSNDSHVFPANSSGAVTDFSGSGTRIEVYEGATELDFDGSGTTAGHFTVTASGTNITPGGISAYDSPPQNSPAGYKVLVADASTGVATGVNTSKIVFTISGKRGNGEAFSITKDQTFSKSKAGADGSAGADTFSSFPHSTGAAQVGGSGLTFILNSIDGVPNSNTGEVYIKGTTFIDAAGTERTGLTENYVATAYGEGVSGIFFLMYTNTAANTRFGGSENSPEVDGIAHQNIVGIRSNGSNGYVLVDNLQNDNVDDSPHANNIIDFQSTDCIVAAVEASATTGGITRIHSFLQGATGSRTVKGKLFFSDATVVGTATGGTSTTLIDTAIAQDLSVFHKGGNYRLLNTTDGTSGIITGSSNADTLTAGINFDSGEGYIIRPEPDIGTAATYDFKSVDSPGDAAFGNLLDSPIGFGWSTEPPEVQVNKSYERYWEVDFSATETGITGSGPVKFGTPVASIRFGANIQSDNFDENDPPESREGWQIKRDSGDAEFNNITARGSLRGGKDGPRDYINYNSPLDSPLPHSETGSTLNTGFYLGPDDSPAGSGSFDFIIGDSTNQLRFDGSSGELDIRGAELSVGSGQRTVKIGNNNIGIGDNFILRYLDSPTADTRHEIIMSSGALGPSGLPSEQRNVSVTPGEVKNSYLSAAGASFFANVITTTVEGTQNALGITIDSYGTLGANQGIKLNHNSLGYYEGYLATGITGTLRWSITDSSVGTSNAKITDGSTGYGGLQLGAIIDSTGDDGTSGYVPTANGSGGWAWAAQTGAGGSVTGSGTANKIAKWSGTSALTDSLITDDGSTVTVGGNFTVTGTTTTVNTTNTTITDNLLELNSGASSNSNDSGIIIERGSTGDNGLFIWDESADKFALGTTTATASSTGNITYTDAGLQLSTLNISDDLVFGNRTTTDGHIQLYNGTASSGYAIGVEASTTYYRSSFLHRWYIATLADGGTSDYMELSTTALTVNAGLNVSGDAAFDTDTLFVDVSTDRVGIGTTSPSVPLQVDATGEDGIVLRNDSTTNLTPLIEVRGQRSDTNNSQACGGGLGLTRWAPNNQIVDSNAVGSIYFGGAYGATTGDEANILYTASIKAEADETWSSSTDMATDLVFRTGSTGRAYAYNLSYGDSEVMRIVHEARVGIGTSTPTYKLDINDDESTGAGLRVQGGGGGGPLARFERDVGSSGCFIDITCSNGDPQIRFTESSGVDWSIGVEGNVFEIVDGSALTGSSKFEINSTGDATIAGDIVVQGGVGTFGISDTTQGVINIYGGATGGEGGEIRIFNNADDDSTYDWWRLDSDGSGNFRIGRAGLTDLIIDQSGNFGIGTSPMTKLHVFDGDGSYPDDANNHLVVESDSHSYIGIGGGTSSDVGIHFGDSGGVGRGRLAYLNGSDAMAFTTNSSERMRIDSAGNVGIGDSTPSYKLDVNGTFRSTGTIYAGGAYIRQTSDTSLIQLHGGNGTGANIHLYGGGRTDGLQNRAYYDASVHTFRSQSGGTGDLQCTGDITAFVSDERLKTRVATIDNAVEKVCSLNGFIYKFNDTAKDLGFDTEKRQVGLSAQEVEKVLPEVIKPAPVDDKYKTLDYAKIVPLLVEAIKEQQEQIENLQKKLEEMSK